MRWATVVCPLLLLPATAPASAAHSHDLSGSSHPHDATPRLYRHGNEGALGGRVALGRKSPFLLDDEMWTCVEVYEHLSLLTVQCLCERARAVCVHVTASQACLATLLLNAPPL
jgi:hypothetical protein